MPKRIPSSREVLNDALALSTEILGDLESGKVALVSIGLKVKRLALLLGDSIAEKIMRYELSGYPTTIKSMPPESWDLTCKAGRQIEFLDLQTGNPRCYVYVESIGKLEEQRGLVQSLLSTGRRPEEIIQIANFLTTVHSPSGHRQLKYSASQLIEHASQRLESRRTMILTMCPAGTMNSNTPELPTRYSLAFVRGWMRALVNMFLEQSRNLLLCMTVFAQ